MTQILDTSMNSTIPLHARPVLQLFGLLSRKGHGQRQKIRLSLTKCGVAIIMGSEWIEGYLRDIRQEAVALHPNLIFQSSKIYLEFCDTVM